MAPAQQRDRRLGRAEQEISLLLALPAERRDAPGLGPGQPMGGARERARMRFRRAAVLAGNDDRREPPERRQAAAPALLGLLA